jgi:DNA-binding NtrC family response regulator
MSDTFRWQALFQQSREPIFVLDRRRRLLFANRAWEVLTGRSFSDLRGLACTRRKTGAEHSVLAGALSPPPEALEGRSARVCRPIPPSDTGPPWWEIDFLPILGDDGLIGILGRIRAMGPASAPASRPVSEPEAALRNLVAYRHRLESLEGRFPSLTSVLSQARLAAQTRCPALILGEPGTGKKWLARAIHVASSVRDRPFLALDADALPAPAVAGVLFGPLGLYRADGAGTIYVLEPWRLSLDVQDELAQRLADSADTGPRIIAGSTLLYDAAKPVAAGTMLQALYDALAVLVIRLPPLRERTQDLPALIPLLVERLSQKPMTVTPEANDCLMTYSWPGNLVELQVALQHAIQRAADARLDVGDLPLVVRQARVAAEIPVPPEDTLPALDTALQQEERRMIRLALEKAKGNPGRAAELLSIWRPRLIRRMKALGMEDDG